MPYKKRKTASEVFLTLFWWGLKRIRTAVAAFAELCLATRPSDPFYPFRECKYTNFFTTHKIYAFFPQKIWNLHQKKKKIGERKHLCMKNILLLWGVVRQHNIVVDESVIAFILGWKSGKFSTNQGKQSHSSLGIGIYCAGLSGPIIQYECGVLFIWFKVFQNLHPDRRFGSTLSFLYVMLFAEPRAAKIVL